MEKIFHPPPYANIWLNKLRKDAKWLSHKCKMIHNKFPNKIINNEASLLLDYYDESITLIGAYDVKAYIITTKNINRKTCRAEFIIDKKNISKYLSYHPDYLRAIRFISKLGGRIKLWFEPWITAKCKIISNSLDVNSLNINSLNINSLDVNSLNINSLDVNSLNINSSDINSLDLDSWFKLMSRFLDKQWEKGVWKSARRSMIVLPKGSNINSIGYNHVADVWNKLLEHNKVNDELLFRVLPLVFMKQKNINNDDIYVYDKLTRASCLPWKPFHNDEYFLKQLKKACGEIGMNIERWIDSKTIESIQNNII
jgi:hypothetical protein